VNQEREYTQVSPDSCWSNFRQVDRTEANTEACCKTNKESGDVGIEGVDNIRRKYIPAQNKWTNGRRESE